MDFRVLEESVKYKVHFFYFSEIKKFPGYAFQHSDNTARVDRPTLGSPPLFLSNTQHSYWYYKRLINV